MKYLVTGLAFVVSMVALFGAAQGTPELELRLSSMKAEQLPSEQADFRLTLVNDGSTPANIDRALLELEMQIQIDGDWIDCRPTLEITPGVVTEFNWRRIGSGDELALGKGQFAYQCLSDGPDWHGRPGEYRLRSTATHRMPSSGEVERLGASPSGAGAWSLTSNAVAVSVVEPTGVDREALQWARQHGHHPVSTEVGGKFPTSHYAALVTWQSLTLHGGDPEQISDYMKQGFHPGRHTVPDASSPDGQRRISAGEEMARWRIEHGTRLLRERPEFPYEREVRLSVAVSYAALGQREQAMRLLSVLQDESGTPESEWASRFVALQGWR